MGKRNYGIDLLRLVLMYMVCMLHTLGRGGILNASNFSDERYKAFWLLEIVSYCSVDGFALISGYMAKDKPQRYSKLADMWFQVFFYSFVLSAVFIPFGLVGRLTLKDIIRMIFPVTFGRYWYFTAYFAMFFAVPLLNKSLFSFTEISSKKALIVLITLFSVLGVVTDPFKTSRGYSTLWLMVLYCIGVLAKRIKLFEKKKTGSLIIAWLLCVFGTWSIKIFAGVDILVNYVSPTILMSGLLMVILFSRLLPCRLRRHK